MIHASELPHMHPHEVGLALGLVLALIVGAVFAVLKRKPAAT